MLLGTKIKKDVGSPALREAGQRSRRLKALDELGDMGRRLLRRAAGQAQLPASELTRRMRVTGYPADTSAVVRSGRDEDLGGGWRQQFAAGPREALQRSRRARALARLTEIAATGQFDELLDKSQRQVSR